MEMSKLLMQTPGKKWIPVNAIERNHVVKEDEYGNQWVCPLLDDSTGISALAICIKEAIHKKRNCPVLVTGDPGIGKSTVIIKSATNIDPGFDESKIAFPLEEFQHIFDTNPYGDPKQGIFPQVDADESAHAMYGPEYLDLEQRVITKNLTISRIKKQIVWFATPKWKLLNPHVRNLITVWVHVSEPDYYYQGYAVVKFAPPQLQSEYVAQKFWSPAFAFIFKPLTGPLWDRYEAKKIAFVNEALSDNRQTSVVKRIVTKLSEKGMTQQEIAEIVGRDRSRISRYLSQSIS